jgi:hypothetical protein
MMGLKDLKQCLHLWPVQHGHEVLLVSSSCAGEARLVGKAWSELATILKSSCLDAAGDSLQADELGAMLRVLCSSVEPAAVLQSLRSWLAQGHQSDSCLVFVGGGETTVTGTLCFLYYTRSAFKGTFSRKSV